MVNRLVTNNLMIPMTVGDVRDCIDALQFLASQGCFAFPEITIPKLLKLAEELKMMIE